jgi:hypothetical protein
MGSHYYADGAMHEEVTRIGGNVTHLSRMWNYADAVRHPRPQRPLHGLKLIPPRSGLVVDPTGRRYGPDALIPTFDARYALERMCEDDRKYYWMICNQKIARRELDVSGSQHNPSIRDKNLPRFLLSILLGKPTLVKHFVDNCPDFVTADSLPELATKMAEVTADDARARQGAMERRPDQAHRPAPQLARRPAADGEVPADRGRLLSRAADRDPDDRDGAQVARRHPDRPGLPRAAPGRDRDRGLVRGRGGGGLRRGRAARQEVFGRHVPWRLRLHGAAGGGGDCGRRGGRRRTAAIKGQGSGGAATIVHLCLPGRA